jgi:hypothetical protein
MRLLPPVPPPAFLAPARPRTEPWRIAATLGVTIFAAVLMGQVLFDIVRLVIGPFWSLAVLRGLEGGRTPLGVLAALAEFLPVALAFALALRLFHDRGWTTLLGPLPLTRATLLWVAGALILLQLVLAPLQTASPDVGRHLTFDRQWPWILPALALILLQSGTEEAIFRGYLLQQLAARYPSPWVWSVLPSALFAAWHIDPGTGTMGLIWSAGTAFAFGLATADITARTGTLGPAIGMHAALNAGGLLILGLYGRMDGLAGWNLVLNPMRPWAGLPYMAIDLMGVLVAWLATRLILRV